MDTALTLSSCGGDLVQEDRQETTWEIGAVGNFVKEKLSSDGQYLNFLPAHKLQKCSDGDTWCCLTASKWTAAKILAKLKYNIDLDISWSFTAVDSGTQPGQGNSIENVNNSIRKNFSCQDVLRPFTPLVTTLANFYQFITQEQRNNAKQQGGQLLLNTAYLPRTADGLISSPQTITDALFSSPVTAVVDGAEVQRSNGFIIPTSNLNRNHEITIVGYVKGIKWIVFDSERATNDEFDWNYPFAYCEIYSLKKKTMWQFCRTSEKKIYVKGLVDGLWHWITSGDFFHNVFGDYKNFSIPGVDLLDSSTIGSPFGPIPGPGFTDEELNNIAQANS